MEYEFLRIVSLLGLSSISKLQAKLLEHCLTFLFSPLLFLLDIHIFLQLILLSMLLKISDLNSIIVHLEFYKLSDTQFHDRH